MVRDVASPYVVSFFVASRRVVLCLSYDTFRHVKSRLFRSYYVALRSILLYYVASYYITLWWVAAGCCAGRGLWHFYAA